MWKRKIKKCLALGLAFAMMTGVAGCGKEQHLEAEINPDIPVSEVQFPLKEQAELSFITSAFLPPEVFVIFPVVTLPSTPLIADSLLTLIFFNAFVTVKTFVSVIPEYTALIVSFPTSAVIPVTLYVRDDAVHVPVIPLQETVHVALALTSDAPL